MNPLLSIMHLLKPVRYQHGDLLGDVKDYATVHVNGVPASEIPEIQDAVQRCHYISAERGEDCGIWVKMAPAPERWRNYNIPHVIILPEEFGTPSRTAGCQQVYSTKDGWL